MFKFTHIEMNMNHINISNLIALKVWCRNFNTILGSSRLILFLSLGYIIKSVSLPNNNGSLIDFNYSRLARSYIVIINQYFC